MSAVIEKEDSALESSPAHSLLLPLTASDVLDGETVAEESVPPSIATDLPFVRNSKPGGLLL